MSMLGMAVSTAVGLLLTVWLPRRTRQVTTSESVWQAVLVLSVNAALALGLWLDDADLRTVLALGFVLGAAAAFSAVFGYAVECTEAASRQHALLRENMEAVDRLMVHHEMSKRLVVRRSAGPDA